MKRRAVLLFLFVLGAALAILATTRDKQPDTRFTGAYRFADGRIAGITPAGEDGWRVRDFSTGEGHTLYALGDDRFTARPGWDPEAPESGIVRFEGRSLVWIRGGQETRAERLPLPERTVRFRSGGDEDVELYGRLVLPSGKGPHPVVVAVHGSEKDAATAYYHEPWLLAPHGVAVLVFDKRGTGRSGGKFGMDFTQLAGDVVAAVEWLKRQPEIDPQRIGLAGYSQGGWIAPLAASKSDAVRFVLVGYGMVDSPAEEDRKETVHALRSRGFGAADIAKAEELTAAAHEIVRSRFESGWERVAELKERFEGEPWVEALGDGTASTLMRRPAWMMRLAGPWVMPRGLDRHWFYDSRPVLERLDIPMLWLIGGDDIEAPNETTLAALAQLRAKGKPFETVVYPGADHGILLFEEKDGKRVYTRYAPGYHQKRIAWILEQVTSPRS